MQQGKRWSGLTVLLAAMLVLGTVNFGYAGASAVNAKEGGHYEEPLEKEFTLYSEIESKLKALKARNTHVMDYEVIGKTSQGRSLFLVTLTDAENRKDLQKHKKFMKDAVNNPQSALDQIEKNDDYKIPVFFNASIHGNETPGTDGMLKLIEKLTTDKSPETARILKNCVVLINVVQNPDGRAADLRENAMGVDLNRDYITQSQPETQAVVKTVATSWYPTTMLDLHGFMMTDNVLLEPCTIPHNPNYEYDLLSKSMFPHARYMADAIERTTGQDVDIPGDIWQEGWDDYPPIFTPQYFMYLGTSSHTLEVRYPDQEGIDTGFTACYASLQYAAENKAELMKTQFEIYNRGVQGLDVEEDMDFPYAYIIPTTDSQQKDRYQAYKMIQHLLQNGIVVEQATVDFMAEGTTYPKGTFIVPMKQGLRGLANTMLWQGEDVTKLASAMYDISAYSFPLLKGFDALAIETPFEATTQIITECRIPSGTFEKDSGENFVIPVENDRAYLAANTLVKEGFQVYRSMDMVSKYPAGTFVVPKQQDVTERLQELSRTHFIGVVGIGSTKATLQPVVLKKIAVVEEDGGTFLTMEELGFDVTSISYNAINHGYDLEENGFEGLILSGSEGFCEDSYDEAGIAWSLDGEGIANLAGFAKNHDFIGAGYAGVMLNEEMQKLDVVMRKLGQQGTQFVYNGFCTLDLKKADPITFTYGKGETIFAYNPMFAMVINNLETVVSGGFPAVEETNQVGFWPESAKAPGGYVILHDQSPDYDAVLFGIIPTFRGYNNATNGLMANAIYYLGYDGK